tara:strand:- start:62 stop:520 length:459 start_codon:yes stop_codon:yes gene_type:complete
MTFNESIKMEAKDIIADSLKITLVDYGSSKGTPSKLFNYKIKNLDGKWIELINVNEGINKFHIENMDVGNFIELIQYDISKKHLFVYYPFLISKNNKVMNFISESLNVDLFTKKEIMKIYINQKNNVINTTPYLVKLYTHLVEIGVPVGRRN